MVVMAIIAILATAGLSAYTSYLKSARDSDRITKVRQLQTIIESLSTISWPPTPTELNAYLTAEWLAWNIVPKENSFLVDIPRSFIEIFWIPNTLALIDDPAGGKPICLDHNKNPTIVCQFVYYQFSDGTYAISYGVEKASNLINAHYSNLSTPQTYGSFVGNSRAITITPTTSTTNIENETTALTALGISNVLAGGISQLNGNVANSGTCGGISCWSGQVCSNNICTDPDACTVGTPAIGTICSDGTVYVSASLRTTAGNESNSQRAWGMSVCTAKGAGWHLPTISELILLCNNRSLIGGWSSTSWYHSSSTNGGYHVTNGPGCGDVTWGDFTGNIRCVKSI